MAIGNVELMHECLPNHSYMGTARMKYNETDQDGKKRGMNMERSKADKKKRSPDGLSLHNQNKIIINMICLCFIIVGKRSMKFN